MKPTPEQLPVIEYSGNHLVVIAYAGCGKTSTLVAYANHFSHLRMLYLAYNRAIRNEGAQKFPKNVHCKTSHQLAWAKFGSKYEHKLGNIRLTDGAQFLETRNWGQVRNALGVLNAYLSSADEEIGLSHAFIGVDEETQEKYGTAALEQAVSHARQLWEAMINPEHPLPCVHDAYLKLFQMSRPQLPYDVILFDEAQDSNPVTAAIVASQSARKIFVGDRHQQIYRWRGAENALDAQIALGADVAYLTNSFRFGPMIAGVANAILMQQGEHRPLVGFGPADKVTTSLPPGCTQYTVLNRTVFGVIMTAIDAVRAGKCVYWNGGIEAYQISDLQDVDALRRGKLDELRNRKMFGQFHSFESFREAADESKDPEMGRLLRIANENNDIPRLIALLRENSTGEPEEADIIVSTCHRSKGLEWDVVMLAEDFPDIFDSEKLSEAQRVDELNLLYVACTRAKKTLVINTITQIVITRSFNAKRAAAQREVQGHV